MAEQVELKHLRKIVICGNIGVGKTTCVRRLTNSIRNSEAIYEKFEENPFLEGFYKVLEENREKENKYNEYCYPTQMAFLNSRAKRELSISTKLKKITQDSPQPNKYQNEEVEIPIVASNNMVYVMDRGLLEDRYIFGQNQIDQGLMNESETTRYINRFNMYMSLNTLPDVIVYLRSTTDTLKNRINKRARDMEQDIKKEYLESLQTLYDEKLIPAIKEEEDYMGIRVLEYETDHWMEDDVFKNVMGDIKKLDNDIDQGI